MDMSDCVIPTRNGRTGSAFTSRGKLNIRNAKFAPMMGPSTLIVDARYAGVTRSVVCGTFTKPAR